MPEIAFRFGVEPNAPRTCDPPGRSAREERRDVQKAASHADPRTAMRYDRARVSLDRHATYIVAALSPAPPVDPVPGVRAPAGRRPGAP
jgi:hypothetical protein